MLVGENNDTVGTVSAHRPTDPDGLVAQVRAVRIRHILLALLGWPCDLEKANNQIMAPNDFWLKFLISYTPKAIPVFLDKLDVVVSYSDGEGADAGMGIAVWSSRCPNGPSAAFRNIPTAIRKLWSKQKDAGFNDIFLIEAIGPLAFLTTFPKVLKGSPWLHYRDNVASEYSLVEGSSSIRSGDVVVGETWRWIQKLGIYA